MLATYFQVHFISTTFNSNILLIQFYSCALYVGFLEQVFFRQTCSSVTALKMVKPKLLNNEHLNKSFGASIDSDEEVW